MRPPQPKARPAPRSLIGTLAEYLKATIAGGLLFLLPIALILFGLGHAMRLAGKVAEPMANLFPATAGNGQGLVTLIAIALLVLVSLVAGLIAKTMFGKRIIRWFENSLLGGLPQYQMVKSMAEGLVQVENAHGVYPGLISVDGGWQLGYLLEPLERGWVAVFVPQAPTPMSGNIMYVPSHRVRPLNVPMIQAMSIVKRMGVGSSALLRGVNLTPPADI